MMFKSLKLIGAVSKKCPRKGLFRNEEGQGLVVIALMMLTFVFFFKFVIDTGLIVSAKINLQNAADLAAYSGASSQARQMNHIAFLNYEMRRQYKKFLFRYYILGSAFQRSNVPANIGTPRIFSPDGQQQNDFTVPVACLPYRNDAGTGNNPGAKQNLCQVPLESLRAIDSPSARPQDAIMRALQETIRQLNLARQAGCTEEGAFNAVTLFNWLYNGNPELDDLEQSMVNGASPTVRDRVRGIFNQIYNVSNGLGIVPQQSMLLQRIKTLEGYVNQPPIRGVTLSRARELENERDKAKNERTLQAFLSAMNTLGGKTFDNPEEIVMDELLPVSGSQADLLRLTEVLLSFTTYYMQFAKGQNDGDCVPTPQAFPVFGLPFGVYKEPESLVYYAVRLKAKARMLFSSVFGGSIELSAYSAAQPFGSRIGPRPRDPARQLGDSPFDQALVTRCPITSKYRSIKYGGVEIYQCDPHAPAGQPLGSLPNLQLLATDGNGSQGGSFLDQGVISAFNQVIGASSNAFVLTSDIIESGYAAAMAPNPIERGRYTIPNDAGAVEGDPLHASSGDPYQKFFTKLNSADRRSHLAYAFWAPLLPPEQAAGKEVVDLVQNIMSGNAQLNQPDMAALKAQAIQGLSNYVRNRLKERDGIAGESFNIATITDPLRRIINGNPVPIALSRGLLMNSIDDLRTSYVPQKSNSSQDGSSIVGPWGRVGYSVKHVAFKTLLNPSGLTSDGKNPWSNGGILLNDPDAAADGAADQLEH